MAYRPTEQTKRAAARRRASLVSAAIELVAEGGFAAASVRAIAERAFCSPGLIYRYFDSHERLLMEVYRSLAATEIGRMSALVTGNLPAGDALAALVETIARRALASPIQAHALLAEPVTGGLAEARLEVRGRGCQALAALVESGVRAGDLPPQRAESTGRALMGILVFELADLLAPAPATPGAEERIAELVALTLRAAGARRLSRAGAG